LLYPPVLTPVLNRLLKLARRPVLQRPLSLRGTGQGVAAGIVQWLFFGGHVWFLAVGLGAPPIESVPLAIGGFALAWCVGYLFVPAPGGIGVREVVLAASLTPVLERADVIVVAITSRAVMTVADLTLAAAAAAALRRRRERRKGGLSLAEW
jgi:uncharacterized membrane protein YbhN (UPF0104 family)